MKKISTLFLCMVLATMSMHAEVWLEENFNYPDGNLEQVTEGLELHKWMCSLKAADALGVSPQVADRNLTYPGYIASGEGKVAVLDAAVGDDASTQRISVYYLDTLGARDTVSMYAAFMIKPVSAKNTSGRDLAIWEGSVGSSMCRGRLFMAKDGDAVKFGITKNSSSVSTWSPTVEVGSTHLIVMKYEYHPGFKNDVVKLWINPSFNKTEEEQAPITCAESDASGQTDMIVRGFGLRQRGNAAEIGGLRIGTSWEDVVKSDGSDIPDQPEKDPEIYAIEDFEYEAGSTIEGQGAWTVSTATADQGGKSPMIADTTLAYAGYGCGEGGALALDSMAQEISGDFKRNTVMSYSSGKLNEEDTVYTAMLVNFSQMNSTSGKELFAYLKQGAASGDNTTMRGRVVVKIAKDKMVLGIKKNNQEITQWSDSLDKAKTALLVVKYVNKSTSSANAPDEFYLYVNPDPSKSEAENSALMIEAAGNEEGGGADLRYIAFRQMKINALIDGIRVAKNWAKALNYQPTDPDGDGDGEGDGDGDSDGEGDGEQALEDIQSSHGQCTKVIRDGQLYLMYKGTMYNVQGNKIQWTKK